MNKERKIYITNIANAVIETLKENDIRLPAGKNLEEIITFFKGKKEEINSSLGSADAVIYKIEEKIEDSKINFVIKVPSYQADTRKVFSITHELGHLFLHMGYCNDWEKWEGLALNNSYERKGIGILESEANEFALCFLMPEGNFRSVFNKFETIRQVSEYFNVSVDITKQRARRLGMIF